MATQTYTPLANITLSGSAASVTFSGISQAYRDLVLVSNPVGVAGGSAMVCNVNGSAAGYNTTRVYPSAGTVASVAYAADFYFRLGFSFIDYGPGGHMQLSFMDYSATDKSKPMLWRVGSTGVGPETAAGYWANTAAITSIALSIGGGNNFTAGSTFALYGVAA